MVKLTPKTHRLKTVDHYYDAVADGTKTYEVRKNDRAFQTGDVLELVRWSHTSLGFREDYGPKILRKKISYLLQGGQFGIEAGYCILGLKEDQPS